MIFSSLPPPSGPHGGRYHEHDECCMDGESGPREFGCCTGIRSIQGPRSASELGPDDGDLEVEEGFGELFLHQTTSTVKANRPRPMNPVATQLEVPGPAATRPLESVPPTRVKRPHRQWEEDLDAEFPSVMPTKERRLHFLVPSSSASTASSTPPEPSPAVSILNPSPLARRASPPVMICASLTSGSTASVVDGRPMQRMGPGPSAPRGGFGTPDFHGTMHGSWPASAVPRHMDIAEDATSFMDERGSSVESPSLAHMHDSLATFQLD